MKNIAIISILTMILLSACTSSNEAIRSAEALGLTEVQTTGYRPFACSESDSFQTGFVAKNAKGDRVKGVVCSGWLKGATVRLD